MIQAREQRLNALRLKRTLREFQHIGINEDTTEIYASDKNKIYVPTPTGKRAHDDNSFVRVIIGPYGSGKSTWCVNEIVRRAISMPAWSRGRRKSRWAIVRNTSGELQSTTLQTWLTWFGELGDIHKRQKPLLTYKHTFSDGNGIIELELIFLALDREEDLRKVKSLELTGAYLNELSEIPQGALSHFKGRVNYRYPSKSFCPEPYWSGIIADTNPPDVDHWIYKTFETQQLDSYRIFHQPPGLLKDKEGIWHRNPDADNANNLSDDYYTKLAEGQTEDFIKVFCLGQYGSVGFGKKVYPEYNDDNHCMDEIKAIQGDPIHLGWDFGLTPSCVVVQMTPRGKLVVLKEYTSEDMGIKSFAEGVVLPNLARDFPYNKIGISRADPSGIKSDEIMEELSCIGTLNALGISTLGARTNDLDARIGAVRYFLNRMVDGRPAFLIAKYNCPVLRRGFTKDYCYKRLSVAGEERYREVPDKNFTSHCFVGETLVKMYNGHKKIEDIRVGDYVYTPFGIKKVLATMSRKSSSLLKITLSVGKNLICTVDHPFITKNGIVRADSLQYSDVLLSVDSKELEEWKKSTNHKNSTALNITEKPKDILKHVTKPMALLVTCIEMFGNIIMGLFQKNITFTTSTMTKVTMSYATFSSLASQITLRCMEGSEKEAMKLKSIWKFCDQKRMNGIDQKREENGIQCTVKRHGLAEKWKNMFAPLVVKPIRNVKERSKKDFVRHIVNQSIDVFWGLIMKLGHALSVKSHLKLTNTQEKKHAPRIVQIEQYQIPKMVYDLTVQGAHCFFAEDILVHNCHDALQYIAMEFAAEFILKDKAPKEVVDMYNPGLRIF